MGDFSDCECVTVGGFSDGEYDSECVTVRVEMGD